MAKKLKIFCTGGAGFVGSHLVDFLIENGHDVTVYDDFSAGKRENVNPKAKIKPTSILDYRMLLKAMQGHDVVFHLAARPRVLYSVKYPKETHDINVNGTLNVLLAAKECGIKKVIFASSSSVCGNTKNFPTTEDEPFAPLSPYAAHKAIGEVYMEMFSKLWGMDITVFRYFNIYGTRCDTNSPYSLVIAKFIKQIKNGESILIYGDGNQSRDFSWVGDIVSATYGALKLKGFHKINVGSGKPISINQLVKLLKKHYHHINLKHVPAVKGEARKTHANIKQAKKLLKWKPKVSIEEGIRGMI